MLRLHPPLLHALGSWIANQEPPPSRPEAIRRLLERALATAAPSGPAKAGSRRKAADLAGRAVTRSATKLQPLRNARTGSAASSKDRMSSATCAAISRKRKADPLPGVLCEGCGKRRLAQLVRRKCHAYQIKTLRPPNPTVLDDHRRDLATL